MRVVGSAAGIDIHAPVDAYFSYFNSPYIGHDIGSAIDIYPKHQEWNGDIVSPVSGRVVKIKKMHMGRPKQFPTDDFDYGIGILPEESDNEIVRIMHCKPVISEGEVVGQGDQIGTAVRSRYFNYWTGPHYHVEIIPSDSFLRSSKSHPLLFDYKFESKKHQTTKDRIDFLVNTVTKDNIVGYTVNLSQASIGDLVGLAAISADEDIIGIIDGGISHYKIGGVIGTSSLTKGSHVYVSDSSVGTIHDTKPSVSFFNRGPSITTFLDDIELRGLSCFIYPKQYSRKKTPQLILIPKQYGQFNKIFSVGDICELRVTNRSNTVKAD